MKAFSELIGKYASIDEAELKIILSHFKERVVKKQKKILIAGQHASEYLFVQSGGIRVYYLNGDEESTLWVALAGQFFTEIESIWNQTPSRFYMEAIEDTELLVIETHTMEMLFDKYPQWQKFGRKIWEKMSVDLTPRVISLLNETAEERYLTLLQQEEIIQKIPLHQLSSLIGITPNSLSRLRKDISRKNDS